MKKVKAKKKKERIIEMELEITNLISTMLRTMLHRHVLDLMTSITTTTSNTIIDN